MSRFVNRRASAVGLEWGGNKPQRSVLPGEVFEAEESEIPKGFLNTFIFLEGSEATPKDRIPAEDVPLESTVEESTPVNEQAPKKLKRV